MLQKLFEREKTHKVWDRHLTCMLMLVLMVAVTLLRGSKSFESLVGIERCSMDDWMVLTFYIVTLGILLAYAVMTVKAEQDLKMHVG